MVQGPAATTADQSGWGLARAPTDARTRLRIVLGLVALLVVALAGLALINSFFVELAPGQPDPNPGGGNQGTQQDPGQDDGGGGGGEGPTCERFERVFYWTFIGLAVVALVLFAVAVLRREHSGGKIGASVWGILSVVMAFLAVLAFGAYRVIGALCEGDLTCGKANDGTYSSFLFLLVLTLAALGLGIGIAHVGRRNFLTTGWGLLGLLMYFPTVLVGFTWFIIRTGCTPDLSCATRDEFLGNLAWIFWCSLAAMVIAIIVGIVVQRKFAHGFSRSGWGVLAILAALLVMGSGAGYQFVDNIYIPTCDPPPEEEEPPEEQTCEETREDIQDRLVNAMWWVGGITVAALAAGLIFHRADLKRFWSSPFAIVAYLGLALLVLLGLLFFLTGSLCGEGDDGSGSGDGGQGQGDGGSSGGDGGSQGGGGSSGGGSPGGGRPGGGGAGSGPGGGGGGIGSANPVTTPVALDPQALSWVLIALLVIIGIAVLIVMLRFRREKGWDGKGGPSPDAAADAVQAKERRDLLAMLAQGRLASDEAVIAAYRAFVAWSAARGMSLQSPETPREHAARVGAKYALSKEEMHGFIAAYEVARLSSRKPTDDERDLAERFTKGLASGTTEADR